MRNTRTTRAGRAALIAVTWLLAEGIDRLSAQDWGDQSFATSSYVNWDRNWNNNGWLGTSGNNTAWKLGVTVDNTNAGVVLRQVSVNSAAARAGLAAGDTIVTVGGEQVGNVGNQLFDLGDTLNRRTDASGRVLLLSYSRRTGQLMPLQVQLDDIRAGLTGTIVLNGRGLPSDSIVTVQLENVSRPYYVVRNGQYTFRPSSFAMGEYPFSLNFDRRYITNSDTYRVRAYVTSGGRTIYDTPQPPLVLTNGNPSTVRLTLSPTNYIPGGGIVSAGYTPVDGYYQQINAAYERYLGRMPNSVEMAAWYQTPDLGYRIQRLPIELMASQEYFDRVGANDFAWVQRTFTEMVGRQPSSMEMDLWMRRLGELRYSRTEFLNQLKLQSGH